MFSITERGYSYSIQIRRNSCNYIFIWCDVNVHVEIKPGDPTVHIFFEFFCQYVLNLTSWAEGGCRTISGKIHPRKKRFGKCLESDLFCIPLNHKMFANVCLNGQHFCIIYGKLYFGFTKINLKTQKGSKMSQNLLSILVSRCHYTYSFINYWILL